MNRTEIKERIGIVVLIAIGYGCMMAFGITCPIKWFTGISCAGCGMTRAWLCILQGHIMEAFYFHPLWFLPVLFGIVYLCKERMPKKIYSILLYVTVFLFLLVYFYRFTFHQDIVVFEPQNSIVFRMIRVILGN